MKHPTKVTHLIGKFKFFLSKDPYYELCDFCKYRRATKLNKDGKGRQLENIVLCDKCYSYKKYQYTSPYAEQRHILQAPRPGRKNK